MLTYKLQKASFKDDDLVFKNKQSFERAMHDGFFLLKIPAAINLEPSIKFCQNFYKEKDKGSNDAYRGFKKNTSIYYDRGNVQVEHIMLDKVQRDKYCPSSIGQLGDEMNQLAIAVIKEIFRKLGINEKNWEQLTGGAISNKGKHWLIFSHYRSEIDKPGFTAHQDTGFVTILYIEDPGLEAFIENRWYAINPEPGYFIINFGCAMEIITQYLPISIKSVLHRVRKIIKKSNQPDRFSLAAFTDIPSELNFYQYTSNGKIEFYKSVKDFLNNFYKNSYNNG